MDFKDKGFCFWHSKDTEFRLKTQTELWRPTNSIFGYKSLRPHSEGFFFSSSRQRILFDAPKAQNGL